MVHRKSTYKLTFKHISGKLRKSIWEENSLMREKRRSDEMSHHSIDESDSECECDDDETEDQGSDEERAYLKKKQLQRRNEEKGTTLKDVYDSGEDEAKASIIATRNAHDYDTKVNDNTFKNNERRQSETEDRIEREKHLCGPTFEPSPIMTDRSKYEESNYRGRINKERKYVSETNLDNLRKTLTFKGNKGVMKFSPSTGEFDLIPARLQNVKRAREEEDFVCGRFNRWPSTDYGTTRNIINIRPRSSVVSAPRPSSYRLNEWRTPSGEGVTFSDMNVERPRRELISTRKEPRTNSSGRDKAAWRETDSSCLRCGRSMRQRGVMT